MKWQDDTNYRRDEPYAGRVPRAWRLKIDSHFHIWVGSDHLYYPGKWVMTCRPWFEARPLGDDVLTAEDAQRKALEMVSEKVRGLGAALAA